MSHLLFFPPLPPPFPLPTATPPLNLDRSFAMGKPKQQVISRFFAPKPPPNPSSSSSPPPPAPSPLPKSSPKISTVVSYSPFKRRSLNLSPNTTPSKKPKPDPLPTPALNPSLHQKFLAKFLDPPSSTSSSKEKPTSSKPLYTPLEQQVLELKEKYPDVILMIEVGYRYRFFGQDADVAARVLKIFAHVDHNFLTASVPTFRLNFHVRRLVGAGYKVGVVKQTETAAIKAHGSNKLGPFTRGLSSLYTKATIEAAESMEGGGTELGIGGENTNYILCVVEKEITGQTGFEVKIGLLAVEISTGDVVHGEFSDGAMRSGLEAVVLSLSPVEILLGEPVSAGTEKLLTAYAGPTSNVRVERMSRDCFNEGGALAEVMSLYENMDDDHSKSNGHHDQMDESKERNDLHGIEGIMALPDLVVQALALTIRYLKEFGLERIICFGSSFRPFSNSVEMTLSANTLHQLEVLRNNSDGSMEGSLFQVMNNTCTSFGSRLFKQWLIHPLCDANLITSRLDAVSEILKSMSTSTVSQSEISKSDLNSVLSSVLTMLGRSPDVERGITRIFHRTAKPTEFIGVIQAILTAGKELQKLSIDKNSPLHSSLLKRLISTASSSSLISRALKLLSYLDKDAVDQGDMTNLFVSSNDQFPEVATGMIAVEMAKEKLDSLISQYRKQLGMRNLEFKTISGTSHLIELSSDMRVPSNWVKISSTKKTTRYHPPEVAKALDELLLAKEELTVVCRSTWDQLLMAFSEHYAHFKVAVQSLAALDCLFSLATLAKDKNFVRPAFVKEEEPRQIDIKGGRHPVLESVLGDGFVPNDTNLREDDEYCQIVTGPNMGGKSCYIRQVALIALMAQVGSYVPATSARLYVLDNIYTRMGASDSIQQGTSTFFEELTETSTILRNCTNKSLVIIDELGRGTSTHDGVAIAYATLYTLIKEKKCMVIFVTHYPKILDIIKEFKGEVGAYHVAFLTDEKMQRNVEEVTFLYKVIKGASDKSFGLNVARLAQLPSSCIARATHMAAKLEADLNKRINKGDEKDEFVAKYSRCKSELQVDSREEFTETFRRVVVNIMLAVGSTDPAKVSCYLKDAREVALRECFKKALV
ncbi:DNA mismatch repair protein MSH3 [Carex littledalei]|uniref:DNA mismatch repair protein n=1 Tax=Carex littledalei TaxID=544730 RepID=A0A833VDV0_9POAL|nr:DNA mismatch repair protein MSH3 [Carex littledalei]